MKKRNLAIIFVVILTNYTCFFLGEYHTLSPIIFLVGLTIASAVSAWTAIKMETKNLVALIVVTLLVAFVDEYAHTSAGTLTYFDNAIPSPLTVFGWSLFIILMLSLTRVLMKTKLIDIQDKKALRILPVLASLILVFAMVVLQGYVPVFTPMLVLVYVLLALASFYYVYGHSTNWNLALMVISLAFGFFMEFSGEWEGLWAFHFMEPVSLFIVFSWPLRIWTILALCNLLNADFSKK